MDTQKKEDENRLLTFEMACLRKMLGISGVMSQNIWGAQSLRGSVATERGEGVGGGVPPPTVGSFFIF